jgi:hypothetical protein
MLDRPAIRTDLNRIRRKHKRGAAQLSRARQSQMRRASCREFIAEERNRTAMVQEGQPDDAPSAEVEAAKNDARSSAR